MTEPKSLIEIISEEEFLPILQRPCSQFLNMYFIFKMLFEKNKDILKKMSHEQYLAYSFLKKALPKPC